MKTYQFLFGLLITVFIGGCSEGGTGESGEPVDAGIAVSYYITEASGSTIVFNGMQGDKTQTQSIPTFLDGIPGLPNNNTHMKGKRWVGFSKTGCQGSLTLIDFGAQTTHQVEIPVAVTDFCQAEIISITQNSTYTYVAYIENGTGYILATTNDLGGTQSLEKMTLDQLPEKLLASEQRLFVQIKDSDEILLFNPTDLNARGTIEISSDHLKLLETPKDEILILYNDQHVILSATGDEINRTLYQNGSAPNFDLDMPLQFYNNRVAYHRTDDQTGNGPAIYDFPQKMVVLYLLTNFIPEQDLNVKYDFLKITAIGMDSENELLLVGYQKNNTEKGGLFRISTQRETKLLDHKDLGFVPKNIWVFQKTE